MSRRQANALQALDREYIQRCDGGHEAPVSQFYGSRYVVKDPSMIRDLDVASPAKYHHCADIRCKRGGIGHPLITSTAGFRAHAVNLWTSFA